MEIYTIGFTKRTAAGFFGTLKQNGIRRLLDIRLHNASQLAGFSKRDDLAFFLDAVGGIAYRHDTLLSPTADLLDAYRRKRISWDEYAERFLALIAERDVHNVLEPSEFSQPTVLLCSELGPEKCHRRLVIEHLARHWPDVKAVHL